MKYWMKPDIYFEPHDIWIGVYWKTRSRKKGTSIFTLYICPLPMLVIRISRLSFNFSEMEREKPPRATPLPTIDELQGVWKEVER